MQETQAFFEQLASIHTTHHKIHRFVLPVPAAFRFDFKSRYKILSSRKLSERCLTIHGHKVTERQIPKVRHELKPVNLFSQTQLTRGADSQPGKLFEDRVDKCRSLLPESECDSVGRIRTYNSLLNA